MLTAVKPRGPASEPLRRCSILLELIVDGIVAIIEVILGDKNRAVGRKYYVAPRSEQLCRPPQRLESGGGPGSDTMALQTPAKAQRLGRQRTSSRCLIEARFEEHEW